MKKWIKISIKHNWIQLSISIKPDLRTIHLQHKWCRIDNLDYLEAHVQNMKRDNGKQQRNKEYKLWWSSTGPSSRLNRKCVTNNLQAISTKGHLEIKQTRNNVFMRQQKKNNYTNTVKQGEKQIPTLNATYETYGLN